MVVQCPLVEFAPMVVSKTTSGGKLLQKVTLSQDKCTNNDKFCLLYTSLSLPVPQTSTPQRASVVKADIPRLDPNAEQLSRSQLTLVLL